MMDLSIVGKRLPEANSASHVDGPGSAGLSHAICDHKPCLFSFIQYVPPGGFLKVFFRASRCPQVCTHYHCLESWDSSSAIEIAAIEVCSAWWRYVNIVSWLFHVECFISRRSKLADVDWLVVWNMFFHILGMSSSQLTDSYFSDGLKPPASWKINRPWGHPRAIEFLRSASTSQALRGELRLPIEFGVAGSHRPTFTGVIADIAGKSPKQMEVNHGKPGGVHHSSSIQSIRLQIVHFS